MQWAITGLRMFAEQNRKRPRKLASTPASAAAALADLPVDPAETEIIRAQKIASILRGTPVAAAANLVNSTLILIGTWGEVSTPILLTWWASIWILSYIVVMAWQRNRYRTVRRAPKRAQFRAQRSAFILALPWAFLTLYFFPIASDNARLLIVAVTAGMACGGGISLARLPHAAFMYVGTILVAGLITVTLVVDEPMYVLAGLTIMYATALFFMINGQAGGASEHARAFLALERQSQVIGFLLKDFEENASDWLWETDKDGRLTYCSQRLPDLLGMSMDDIKGHNIHRLAAANNDDTSWRRLLQLCAHRQPFRDLKVPVSVNDQKHWWSLTAKPKVDDHGRFTGYRGVGSDVTLLKAADDLRLAKDQAEEANAAKPRFLAVMTHELRTPLNSIIGFSELIARERIGPIGTPEYLNYAQNILDSSHQLLDIINEALDMARLEYSAVQLHDTMVLAAELLEASVSFLAPAASNAGIDVALGPVDEHVCILGDSRLLKQIVLNILSNAIKFTPSGGRVSVKMAKRENGDLVISISDTGVGVSKAKIEQIFEPFVQAEDAMTRRVGGVGLGLSIARQLARAHGGDVLFESDEGRGSTVSLLLPAERIKDAEDWSAAPLAAAG